MARYGRQWRSEPGAWRRQRHRRWSARHGPGEGPGRYEPEPRRSGPSHGYARDVYGLGFEPGYAPGYGYDIGYGGPRRERRGGGRQRAGMFRWPYGAIGYGEFASPYEGEYAAGGGYGDEYGFDEYAAEFEAYAPEEYEAAGGYGEEFDYGFPYAAEYPEAAGRREWRGGGRYDQEYGRGRGEGGAGGRRPRFGHTPSDRWPEDTTIFEPGVEPRFADDDIRENVYEALFQDTWIDPRRLRVGVRDGVVTLSGEVADFMEARYAWDDAWETPGVRGVINNLTVRADLPREGSPMPQTRHRFPMIRR